MFTVWIDYYTEGWSPSEPLPDLAAVLEYITYNTYSHTYRVTRDVDLKLVENL